MHKIKDILDKIKFEYDLKIGSINQISLKLSRPFFSKSPNKIAKQIKI